MIRRSGEMEVEYRKRMKGGEGTVKVTHLLKKDDFKARVRLCAHLSVPVKGSIGFHEHPDEDEVFIITRGEGILYDGKKESPVSVGDAILTGDGEGHSLTNAGNTGLELFAFITKY